jgi:uncharacterized coiled-coil DUF342 family protein
MDLEKEVSSLQGTNESLEKVTHELSCECDKLKLEHGTTSRELLEKEEEISELHQKLNAKVNDYVILQQELQGKLSQLSLTQLRVQQVCLFPFIILQKYICFIFYCRPMLFCEISQKFFTLY